MSAWPPRLRWRHEEQPASVKHTMVHSASSRVRATTRACTKGEGPYCRDSRTHSPRSCGTQARLQRLRGSAALTHGWFVFLCLYAVACCICCQAAHAGLPPAALGNLHSPVSALSGVSSRGGRR